MQYRCLVCDENAVIRVFSGRHGGGFPGCAVHQNEMIDSALKPLVSPTIDPQYSVIAYPVICDQVDNWPRMGRLLWVAKPKRAVSLG